MSTKVYAPAAGGSTLITLAAWPCFTRDDDSSNPTGPLGLRRFCELQFAVWGWCKLLAMLHEWRSWGADGGGWCRWRWLWCTRACASWWRCANVWHGPSLIRPSDRYTLTLTAVSLSHTCSLSHTLSLTPMLSQYPPIGTFALRVLLGLVSWCEVAGWRTGSFCSGWSARACAQTMTGAATATATTTTYGDGARFGTTYALGHCSKGSRRMAHMHVHAQMWRQSQRQGQIERECSESQ